MMNNRQIHVKSRAGLLLSERGGKARKMPEHCFAKSDEVSYVFQKKPWLLTKILQAMLCIMAVFALSSLFLDVLQWKLINLSQSGLLVLEDVAVHDRWNERIALVYFAWVVVTGVLFLVWVNQASRNCHGFNALNMRFTPAEATCCYLLPIICLYRPYWVMRELWEVSCNPRGWERTRNSTIVGVWWAVHLIALFFALLSFWLYWHTDGIASAKKATFVSMLSNSAVIVLVVLLTVVTTKIIRMQMRLVGQKVRAG